MQVTYMYMNMKILALYPVLHWFIKTNYSRKLPCTVMDVKSVWSKSKLLLTPQAYSPLTLMLAKLTSSSEYVLVSVWERLGSEAGNTSLLLWLHSTVSGVGLPSKVQFSTSVEFTVNVVFPGVKDKILAGSEKIYIYRNYCF